VGSVEELFRRRRKKLGFEVVDVVRKAGYKSINKGIRHYEQIEQGSVLFPKPEIYRRFIEVLGIEEQEVIQTMQTDLGILDQPVPPRLIIRGMPAIYIRHRLPEGCTTEEAIAIGERVARERNKHVCVTLARIRGLYITPEGERREHCKLPSSSFVLSYP
jgi:transcriptional regulator with XRE-family HTH domain